MFSKLRKRVTEWLDRYVWEHRHIKSLAVRSVQKESVKSETQKAKEERRKAIAGMIWEIVSVSILGANSILILYSHFTLDSNMRMVIYALLMAYIPFAIFQIVATLFFRKNARLKRILFRARKIFKIIYVLVYIDTIIITIVRITDAVAAEQLANLIIYNIALFIWIISSGSAIFWTKPLGKFVSAKWHGLKRDATGEKEDDSYDEKNN